MLSIRAKIASLITMSVLALSGCAPSYQVSDSDASAKFSIRSPQGYLVDAQIFSDAQYCAYAQILKASDGNQSVKTFKIKAGAVAAFKVSVDEYFGTLAGYSCHQLIRFPVEAGNHYVLNSLLDKSKRVCKHSLVERSNPEQSVYPEFSQFKTDIVFSKGQPMCKNLPFEKSNTEDGSYETALYEKISNTYYSETKPLEKR